MNDTIKYDISKYVWGNFQYAIDKLNRRAKRLKCTPLTYEIIKEYNVEDKDGMFADHYYTVEISGQPPQVKGYKFVGKVEHIKDGVNIVYNFQDGLDLNKYRKTKSYCDHCKTRRYRKNTYIFQNTKTGKTVQIGSTCVKDFFGHSIPELTVYGEVLKTLDDLDSDYDMGSSAGRYINLDMFMLYATNEILQYGFISKTKAKEEFPPISSTADIVLNIMYDNVKVEISDKAKALKDKVMAWGKSLSDRKDLNDYMYNLSVIFQLDYIDFQHIGFAASAVTAYQKEKDQLKPKQAKKESQYFGTVGKREDFELTYKFVHAWSGHYGYTFLYKFEDKDGNVAIWKSSNDIDFDIDEKVTLKGTVKEHSDYDGIKQTVLTRCKVMGV